MPWKLRNDLTGQTFGKWFVIQRDLSRGKRPVYFLCRCICGKESPIPSINLVSGKSTGCTSCGGREFHVGDIIGDLVVVSIAKGKSEVKCKCGNQRWLRAVDIKRMENCGHCIRWNKIGKSYGCLTVTQFVNEIKYKTICLCGKELLVTSDQLDNKKRWYNRTGKLQCSCDISELNTRKAADKTGEVIGVMKIVKFIGMDDSRRAVYKLRCKCGKNIIRRIKHLYGSESCGCIRSDRAPKGSKNRLAILNEMEVSALRSLYKTGLYTGIQLAEMFGVTPSAISNIILKNTWKHVKDA